MYTDEDLKHRFDFGRLLILVAALLPLAAGLFMLDGRGILEQGAAALGLMSEEQVARMIEDIEYNYYYSEVFETDAYREVRSELTEAPLTTYGDFNDYLTDLAALSHDPFSYFYYDSLLAGFSDFSDYEAADYEDGFETFVQEDLPVIRFNQFAYDTGTRVTEALREIHGDGGRVVVFDLTDNPGGIIGECVMICYALLPATDIFEEQYNDRSRYTYVSDEQMLDFDKIVILLNGESASCSEIMALTLKEHLKDKVLLVGSDTYGKQVTQSVDENDRLNYALYLVTAAWTVEGKSTEHLRGYLSPWRGKQIDSFEKGFREARRLLDQEKKTP